MMFILKARLKLLMEPSIKIGKKMKKKLLSSRQQGFTLIEMIIVFTLIGILVGLGIPQYKYAVKRARESVLRENLFQMRKLINQYYADKGKYPPSLQALVDEEYLQKIPIDPITKSSETWVEVRKTLTDEEIMAGQEPGVIDVLSGSDKKGLDGTPYNTW